MLKYVVISCEPSLLFLCMSVITIRVCFKVALIMHAVTKSTFIISCYNFTCKPTAYKTHLYIFINIPLV